MNMYVEVVVINLLMASFVMVNSAEDDTDKAGERSRCFYYIFLQLIVFVRFREFLHCDI